MTQPLEFLLLPDRGPASTFVAVLLLSMFAVFNLMTHLSKSNVSRNFFLFGGGALAVAAALVQFVPFSTGVERLAFSPGRAIIYKFNGDRVTLGRAQIAEADFVAGSLVFTLKNGETLSTQYIPVTQRGGIMQAIADVLFSDEEEHPKPKHNERGTHRYSESTILKIESSGLDRNEGAGHTYIL